MSLRRKSREYALQMLFQWEMGKQDPSGIENGFWANARAQKSTREFANQLFENAAARVAELDPIISKHAENWRIERMPAIDRAGLKGGNKGHEAGMAAIEMANLSKQLRAARPSPVARISQRRKAR